MAECSADDAVDRATLLCYYEEQEPEFATDEKVGKVIKSFRKKAKKAGTPGAWREMMYAAFVEQRGIDPRDHYTEQQERTTATGKATQALTAQDTPEQSPTSKAPEPAETTTPLTLAPEVSPAKTPGSATPAPGSRLARLDSMAVTPPVATSETAEPQSAQMDKSVVEDPELEEEMSAVREDYLMDLFTNCQTCLDPISGEKLLVADLR